MNTETNLPGLSDALRAAIEALEEIALAGMSGTGQETEEGMQAWHARRAWEFIRIAARALEPARAAIAAHEAQRGKGEPVANPYPSGSVREGWQRGYEGRPMLAAPGSDYAKAYEQGVAAMRTMLADLRPEPGALEQALQRVEKLQELAATCYAGLGAECDLPDAWLDALSSAANGEDFSTDGLLPYTAQAEPDTAQEPVALTTEEIEQFHLAVEQFDDDGETIVDYKLLMRFASLGLMECTRFQVTKAGTRFLEGQPFELQPAPGAVPVVQANSEGWHLLSDGRYKVEKIVSSVEEAEAWLNTPQPFKRPSPVYLSDSHGIAAQQAPSAREVDGWKLVPVEPSISMMEAAAVSQEAASALQWSYADCYRAMLAATPQPPATQEAAAREVTDMEDSILRSTALRNAKKVMHPAEIRYMNLELDIHRVINCEKPLNEFEAVKELQDYIQALGKSIQEGQEPLTDEQIADAARYQWLRSGVQGDISRQGWQKFELFKMPSPQGNIMQGSVAQHFDKAIDAAIAAQQSKKEPGA